jgi:murein DD-endopeptidase MepM/ murein hydrolase activator NlpD
VLVFLSGFLFTVMGFGRVWRSMDAARLAEENRHLRTELHYVENRVNELAGMLEGIEETQRWSRNLADLEPLDEAAMTGGVGGPQLETLATQAAGVDRRLDRLYGRSNVMRSSAEQVYTAIRGEKEALARIPSIPPVMSGRVTSLFGGRIDPFTGQAAIHQGLDISARIGTPIMVSAAGRVVQIQQSAGGLGNMIVVDHGNGFITRYGHCDRIAVSEGQVVSRGEVIGTVGNSGHSTAPHLHYEVYLNGEAQNPDAFILSSDFIVD